LELQAITSFRPEINLYHDRSLASPEEPNWFGKTLLHLRKHSDVRKIQSAREQFVKEMTEETEN
jgi:hypothetical protein